MMKKILWIALISAMILIIPVSATTDVFVLTPIYNFTFGSTQLDIPDVTTADSMCAAGFGADFGATRFYWIGGAAPTLLTRQSGVTGVDYALTDPMTVPAGAFTFSWLGWYCGNGSLSQYNLGQYFAYNATSDLAPVPVASFSCVPTSQFPNADVVCTDSSSNTTLQWYWTIDAEALGIKGWQTSNSRNITWQSAYAGLYSVNLRVTNSGGSDWENKTDYVSISANATPNNCYLPKQAGYVRSVFQCLNSQNSAAIDGCDIQLRDNEAGAWSNATSLPDGVWCLDTLPAHSINAYAQASGYSSTSRVNLPALDEIYGMYALLLIPGYVPAAPAGSVYLYVTVNDYDLHANGIAGATVTAGWSGGSDVSGITDSHGTAILTVKNSTSVYLTASASGYVSINKVITTTPTGPDSVMLSLHKATVTVAPTGTVGPGGTVPVTQNPNKDPNTGLYDPGYANQQGQQMMGFLAENGMSLLMLCVLATMMGLIKMMTK